MFESSDLDFPSDGPPPPAAALQLALEDQRRSPLAAPTPGAEAGGGGLPGFDGARAAKGEEGRRPVRD